MFETTHSRPQPLDQADGLRRMFGAAQPRIVAVASNLHVAFSGVLLERLTAAFAALGCHSLVVDASENAPAPHELAMLDLAACVEPVSAELCYLAARGLPLQHVDARGSSAAFLDAVADAAPQADVIVVHAPATDLSRLLAGRALRPLLLAADHPRSVTQAYGAMKLLALRNGLMTYDLLLSAEAASPRRNRIAEQLAGCADRFLGAVLHDAALVDPASDTHELPCADLLRVAGALLSPGFGMAEAAAASRPAAAHALNAWPSAAATRI